MGTLPSKEENGKMVLGIYSHFDIRPGEVLMSNNFVAWAGRNRVRIDDVTTGLDYAVEKGWLVEKPNGFLELTESGFCMM